MTPSWWGPTIAGEWVPTEWSSRDGGAELRLVDARTYTQEEQYRRRPRRTVLVVPRPTSWWRLALLRLAVAP